MDNKISITHYKDHEEDNINIQTEVLSDSIHCNTKGRNDNNCDKDNGLPLTCIDDINECTLDQNNTTLKEDENIKHYIEHDTDDMKVDVTQNLHYFLLVMMASMNITLTMRALFSTRRSVSTNV